MSPNSGHADMAVSEILLEVVHQGEAMEFVENPPPKYDDDVIQDDANTQRRFCDENGQRRARKMQQSAPPFKFQQRSTSGEAQYVTPFSKRETLPPLEIIDPFHGMAALEAESKRHTRTPRAAENTHCERPYKNKPRLATGRSYLDATFLIGDGNGRRNVSRHEEHSPVFRNPEEGYNALLFVAPKQDVPDNSAAGRQQLFRCIWPNVMQKGLCLARRDGICCRR